MLNYQFSISNVMVLQKEAVNALCEVEEAVGLTAKEIEDLYVGVVKNADYKTLKAGERVGGHVMAEYAVRLRGKEVVVIDPGLVQTIYAHPTMADVGDDSTAVQRMMRRLSSKYVKQLPSKIAVLLNKRNAGQITSPARDAHWYVLVFDLTTRKAIWFDSACRTPSKDHRADEEEVKELLSRAARLSDVAWADVSKYDHATMYEGCPQQPNAIDCGVYALWSLRCIVENDMNSLASLDAAKFRMMIGAKIAMALAKDKKSAPTRASTDSDVVLMS
jgi:hypothetical protein